MAPPILTSEIQRFVREQRLGFVATVGADGRPNLSPKGTTTVWDDEHLMFADIASPQTIRNLLVNPHVEINVVDPIVRKGWRFRGTGTVYRDGPRVEQGLGILAAGGSTTPHERIASIVVVAVTEANPLFSPAYDSGLTEEDLAPRWLSHFTGLHAGLLP
jgi:uncharacterized protein